MVQMRRMAVPPVAIFGTVGHCHPISLIKVHHAQEDNIGSVSTCPTLAIVVVRISVGTSPPWWRRWGEGKVGGEGEGN